LLLSKYAARRTTHSVGRQRRKVRRRRRLTGLSTFLTDLTSPDYGPDGDRLALKVGRSCTQTVYSEVEHSYLGEYLHAITCLLSRHEIMHNKFKAHLAL
jgi:hypothetical protein